MGEQWMDEKEAESERMEMHMGMRSLRALN